MIPQQKTLKVSGMSCGNCAASVKKSLENLEGVVRADVSHENGEAVVTYDNATVPEGALAEAVKSAGFEVQG